MFTEAIKNRRSTRSFYTQAVESDIIKYLKDFSETLEVPFEHDIKVAFFKAQPNKKLYTMMDAPADNMAFLADTDYISISKAGFIGELMILKATELGLATCWFGHYHQATLNEYLPHLKENDVKARWSYGKGPVKGKRVICISPLGKWKNKGLRLIDRMQEKTISFKRKEISDLLVEQRVLDDDLSYALDLARKAPSAGNGQFWRFEVSEDLNSIKVYMPVGYKHLKWEHPNVDIGITASHLWLGLKTRGIKSEIQIYEDQARAVWHFKLDRH